MNGIELYELARRLMQIGQSAIADPTDPRRLPPGVRLVLSDVVEHLNASVTDIAERTGVGVAGVETCAATLRDVGAVTVEPDPTVPGRTVVRPVVRPDADGQVAEQIDEQIVAAAGIQDVGRAKEMVDALQEWGRRLAEGIYTHYEGTAPWDIGRPQPALRALAEAGAFHGRVVEMGCGTGEQTLMAAALGLPAVGVDSTSTAITVARRKAHERGLDVTFLVGDALALDDLGAPFDTVLDCGLFHMFSDPERIRYADSLAAVTSPGARLFLLCYSDRHPPGKGPRRVSRDEIRATFADGWRIDAIEPATLDNSRNAGGVPAWLATITRT